MQRFRSNIDRPLGQEERGRRGRIKIRPGQLLLVFCAVAIVAASGAIALRERPFRHPPPLSDKDIGEPPLRKAQGEVVGEAYSKESASIERPKPASNGSQTSIIVVRDPSAVGQNPRLAHLPDRALIEQTELGPLPIRDEAGRRPFDVYAGSWSGARGARIALVIGGLGISQTGTQSAIAKLPSGITLAFAPLGNSLTRWMQTARREGHEIMLQVPLEPFGYPQNNPGPHTLLTQAGPQENLRNLRWALSRVTNYTGVVNYMGARFTADDAAMNLFLGELGERGLGFLDDGTSVRSIADAVARSKGVPFAAGDSLIDQERERGAILAELDELERIARARGFAVGTGSALDVTVDTVAYWAGEVTKRGIEIVPFSAVAENSEGR